MSAAANPNQREPPCVSACRAAGLARYLHQLSRVPSGHRYNGRHVLRPRLSDDNMRVRCYRGGVLQRRAFRCPSTRRVVRARQPWSGVGSPTRRAKSASRRPAATLEQPRPALRRYWDEIRVAACTRTKGHKKWFESRAASGDDVFTLRCATGPIAEVRPSHVQLGCAPCRRAGRGAGTVLAKLLSRAVTRRWSSRTAARSGLLDRIDAKGPRCPSKRHPVGGHSSTLFRRLILTGTPAAPLRTPLTSPFKSARSSYFARGYPVRVGAMPARARRT